MSWPSYRSISHRKQFWRGPSKDMGSKPVKLMGWKHYRYVFPRLTSRRRLPHLFDWLPRAMHYMCPLELTFFPCIFTTRRSVLQALSPALGLRRSGGKSDNSCLRASPWSALASPKVLNYCHALLILNKSWSALLR